MFARRDKKPTPEQQLAQMRREALDHADQMISIHPDARGAADHFLKLKEAEDRVQQARAATLAHAFRSADSKRFWTAFGMNTPLVASLVLMEPITGTMALLTTVLMGYAPTTLLKRMLDDHKLGDAKALKAVMMDIETLDIATARVQERCSEVQAQHLDTLRRTPSKHPLLCMYPSLVATFEAAAEERAEDARRAARAAKATPAAPSVRRFGL
mgnify:CR=1 FL=1